MGFAAISAFISASIAFPPQDRIACRRMIDTVDLRQELI